MNVLDFFKKDKPLKEIVYPSAQVAGKLTIQNHFENDDFYEEPLEQEVEVQEEDYAEEFIRQDEEEYINRLTTISVKDEESMSAMETATPNMDLDGVPEYLHAIDSVYTRYNFAQEIKPDLIMHTYEQSICDLVEAEKIVVIQGPTGCGKSTQVPQYILNYCKARNRYCKIAVTQPRRIAAITVARRVSQERGWPLGSVVGYRVGLDAQVGEDTILTYMTTGVLLQQLVNAKNMNMYTHIILDEVHERDQEMDFLLLVVRKFFRQQLCRTRLILMSATIDTDQFSQYFARPSTTSPINEKIPVPVLNVCKPTAHIVNIFYLDQLYQLVEDVSELEFDIDIAKLNDSLFSLVEALLTAFDKTDGADAAIPGSVLVFLPGIYEIEELYHILQRCDRSKNKIKWLLIPLHSSITVEEQKRAFEEPPPGHRKIILSTNIAESSITVPDVVYAIDFCLTKILVCDTATNYSHLRLTWASRSNCIQRAGRVGRVRTGRVYRFVYQNFYENEMLERIPPEILRCPLHRLVLLAKMLEMGPPHKLLALAMDRPNLSNIKQTIDALKEAGGLLLTTTKESMDEDQVADPIWDDLDGDLTTVGRIMAKLPLDINCSRLIIFGHMFGVLRETIIMAAAMSLQSIFSNPFNERMRAYTSKLNWAHGSFSDLVAYLHVYLVWEKYKYSNPASTSGSHHPVGRMNKDGKIWLQKNFLQPRVMREWHILVTDLKQRLNRAGVVETNICAPGRSVMSEHEKAMMLKVVICGAFYPNYFIRSSEGGQINEADAVKTLGGRDPYTTVYFTGKEQDQPGQLYVTPIRQLLKDCGNDMHISFDAGGSGKVYVQFRPSLSENEEKLPGRVAVEVYRAVKYRQLKMQTVIRCLSAEEGKRRLEKWREQQKNLICNAFHSRQFKSPLPGPEIPHIEVKITHTNSPHNFFIHNYSVPELENAELEISQSLNERRLELVKNVSVGEIYAAPYNRKYYRARATYVNPAGPDGQPDVHVIFIDYGYISRVTMSQLRELTSDLKQYPPLALQCTLAHIQPALNVDGRAAWSNDAIEMFKQMTQEMEYFATIYSVVDGVCAVELYNRTSNHQNSINEMLVSKGFAQNAQESYLSQDDHHRRVEAQTGNNEDAVVSSAAIEADPWSRGDEQNVPPPLQYECRRSMKLRGPFSPLEMQIYSLVQCGTLKTVNIEWNSVNSVLLDTNPQDGHDRLLVAGSVSTNADATRLTLRHTTMMPNLRGFPAIMALIFAPRAVLHMDNFGARVTSILCGMGCNKETLKPRYGQHDIVFTLDFDLATNDMNIINEIREYMNLLMEAVRCSRTNEHALYPIETCQTEIQHRIRTLLKKHRESRERILLPRSRSWQCASTAVNQSGSVKDIWPIHEVHVIQKQNPRNRYRRHLETMRDMAENVIPMTEITCMLCNAKIYNQIDMRTHLLSRQHRLNSEQQEMDED